MHKQRFIFFLVILAIVSLFLPWISLGNLSKPAIQGFENFSIGFISLGILVLIAIINEMGLKGIKAFIICILTISLLVLTYFIDRETLKGANEFILERLSRGIGLYVHLFSIMLIFISSVAFEKNDKDLFEKTILVCDSSVKNEIEKSFYTPSTVGVMLLKENLESNIIYQENKVNEENNSGLPANTEIKKPYNYSRLYFLSYFLFLLFILTTIAYIFYQNSKDVVLSNVNEKTNTDSIQLTGENQIISKDVQVEIPFSGYYRGGMFSGYVGGTDNCEMRIEENGDAMLHYALNAGNGNKEAIEYGKVVLENNKYYFNKIKPYAGGRYSIIFENNTIYIGDGKTWEAELFLNGKRDKNEQASEKENDVVTNNYMDVPNNPESTTYINEAGKLVLKSDCYVIITGSYLYENDAKNEVNNMRNDGYSNSGYLWIPDYPSLSGKEFFASFVGPFETYDECFGKLKNLKRTGRFWYGIKVSHSPERIEIQATNSP